MKTPDEETMELLRRVLMSHLERGKVSLSDQAKADMIELGMDEEEIAAFSEPFIPDDGPTFATVEEAKAAEQELIRRLFGGTPGEE
ncbi:MAG: hypothetical protein K6T83_12230 [Alicyclobacillus sp.]|nr:hypothetical protein [Alicyclobacillus sp.]